jgi:hypothetical protein
MGEERIVSGGVYDHGTQEEDGPGTWEARASGLGSEGAGISGETGHFYFGENRTSVLWADTP